MNNWECSEQSELECSGQSEQEVQNFKCRFDDVIQVKLTCEPKVVEKSSPKVFRHLIVDCSGMTAVDFMGVNALKEVFSEMQEQKVLLYFAAAKAPVRELFESCGFFKHVSKENFYPTVHDAVLIAQQREKK